MITPRDKEYPELLKGIGKTAPKKIYYNGEWDSTIFKNCLAVVGSRRMTSYGKRVTEKIVTEVAAAGITIVSGFMYGVDATAHRVAVDSGGRTIAVMPCGIDLVHPSYQHKLYNDILDNRGLIISEYEGETAPANWTYPKRNRIVAGLSQALLVIEAEEKSGSLITADLAKKYKRKIFAIPGPITSTTSRGTLGLIKEGAELVITARDILDYFKSLGFSYQAKLSEFSNEDNSQNADNSKKSTEKKIVTYLEGEPLGVDELSRLLNIPVSKLGVTLSIMQLRGLISQSGTKYYIDN